jgi:hypothetical protein
MTENINFDQVLSAFAKKIAAFVMAEMDDVAHVKGARLLDVEKAALYLGRTEEAMQHMIATGKVSTVRIDRRVFLDIRELDALIDNHKTR